MSQYTIITQFPHNIYNFFFLTFCLVHLIILIMKISKQKAEWEMKSL